ncbi:MAG: hypothetical protein HY394_02225 [Candidatus Diapherotrites archaeon]|nr:hypothetical protein [Candidatus Diapherotrites archaeon]
MAIWVKVFIGRPEFYSGGVGCACLNNCVCLNNVSAKISVKNFKIIFGKGEFDDKTWGNGRKIFCADSKQLGSRGKHIYFGADFIGICPDGGQFHYN